MCIYVFLCSTESPRARINGIINIHDNNGSARKVYRARVSVMECIDEERNYVQPTIT
jgi:hypothetical protein